MRLFKYFAPERTEVITDLTLGFSSYKAFNDPFELDPPIAYFSSFKQFSTRVYPFLVREFLDFYIKERERRGLPVMSHGEASRYLHQTPSDDIAQLLLLDLHKTVRKELNDVVKKLGILCLTPSRKNLLMWSHYASGHKGFAIEFDCAHPFFSQRHRVDKSFMRGVQKVVYSDERSSLSASDDLQSIQTAWFLTKGKDWKYENEWRCFKSLRDADKVINTASGQVHLFNLPSDCIKSVTFGALMPSEIQSLILNALREAELVDRVLVEQAVIDPDKYELQFERVSF